MSMKLNWPACEYERDGGAPLRTWLQQLPGLLGVAQDACRSSGLWQRAAAAMHEA